MDDTKIEIVNKLDAVFWKLTEAQVGLQDLGVLSTVQQNICYCIKDVHDRLKELEEELK